MGGIRFPFPDSYLSIYQMPRIMFGGVFSDSSLSLCMHGNDMTSDHQSFAYALIFHDLAWQTDLEQLTAYACRYG